MSTIKQLAIALNLDIGACKAKFATQAQQAGNYELADQISQWEPDTPIPEFLEEAAIKAGVNISRNRKPKKGVKGDLANPPEIVQEFIKQVPALMNSSLSGEQQLFIGECSFAGKMSGLAGSLAFQKDLLDSFVKSNEMFRKSRSGSIEQLREGITEEFANLFSGLCDVNRALAESSTQINEQIEEFDNVFEQMNQALGK